MTTFIFIVELIGTIAFSISGSVIAIRHNMDIFGVVVLGSTTAVGGGFLRDIVLQREDISIFYNPVFVIVATITSLIVFLVFYFIRKFKRIPKRVWDTFFNIVDAIGLGVFVVTGVNVTSLYTDNTFMIMFCSVLTAVGGGIIRDIFANIIPGVFRKYIYASSAILGSILYYVLFMYNANVAVISTVMFVVILRYLSFKYEWSLPKIKLG